MKTDLDELNEYLIAAGNVKRVGVRKKIVLVRQWLNSFVKRKSKEYKDKQLNA